MSASKTSRRLAAILVSDIVGYSAMMERDEGATLAALKSHRESHFNPTLAEHGGRLVKLLGDGALIEFSSVVDAVNFAIDLQRRMAAEPEGIVLRIGINLGDIVIDGDDIYGDGVNVAARLEPLADAGGICIAASVSENIRGRIAAAFADGGEVTVKNIDRPIRVWKWHPDGAEPAVPPVAALPLPSKPSIAVLPFANLSGDPEQDYFADGITEDITSALSRIHAFFVIARNTAFTYKGVNDLQRIGRELGVRYILEGSVRKAGKRLRISAQLVDAETGNYIWSDKYDRDLQDVFEIQDEITGNIAGALEPQIVAAEYIRSQRKNVQNLDAWDLVIQAMARIGDFSNDGSKQAIDLLDRALAIDPKYARAYSQKAWILAWRIHQGLDDRETMLPVSIAAAEAAVRYDPDDQWAYIAWMFIANLHGEVDRMMSSGQRAIEINPNFALAQSFVGVTYALTGRGAEAFEWIDRARRLSPRDIFRDEFELHTCMAYFQLADYRKAAEFAARASTPRPEHVYPHLMLAASLAHLGALDAARDEIVRIRRLVPDLSLAGADRVCVYIAADDRRRFIDGLRIAGVT